VELALRALRCGAGARFIGSAYHRAVPCYNTLHGGFAERGALDSMVHGDVPLSFVKRYHPGWYKEIAGEPASPKK